MARPDAFLTLGAFLELFSIISSLIKVSSSREIVDCQEGWKGGGQEGGLRRERGARIQNGS
jgi:hypothetical protein